MLSFWSRLSRITVITQQLRCFKLNIITMKYSFTTYFCPRLRLRVIAIGIPIGISESE